MRALLITQQGIEKVQLETVDGNQLHSMYRLIDCRTVTGTWNPVGYRLRFQAELLQYLVG